MKTIAFLGGSLEAIKAFPLKARREAGYELNRVQHGENPHDWKPMKSIGAGVRELRIRDESGIFRVVYVVKYLDQVHVLHAFQKKTFKTSRQDLDLAKQRLQLLLQEPG